MTQKNRLEDIARRVGCSTSQASRALSGKGSVAPEIRARLLSVAKELDYRNLSRGHTPKIALLCKCDFGVYESKLLRVAMQEASARGWKCMILDEGSVSQIRENFFDGLLFIGCNDERIVQQWPLLSSIPLVVINGYGNAIESVCTVDPDQFDESQLVLAHLKEFGHRRIARLHQTKGPASARFSNRGDDAFLQCAARLGLGEEVVNISFDDRQPLGSVFGSLLRKGITAFFVIHQGLAIPSAHALRKLGVRIPEDASFVSYEVEGISEFFAPPLTTLDFDYQELARLAFDELSFRIKRQEQAFRAVLKVPNVLHIRESVAKPRKRKINNLP